MFDLSPLCPRCVPWARAAGWGFPTPFPFWRPLTLGACNRSGGPLSSVSPPSVSRYERARLGFSSPSSSQIRPTLWFVAPWLSSPAAGPALARPLSDDSDASNFYLRRASALCLDLPPSVPSKCSGMCPAPTSPSPCPLPPSFRVVPRRLRRLALAPWLLRRWVGFRSLCT